MWLRTTGLMNQYDRKTTRYRQFHAIPAPNHAMERVQRQAGGRLEVRHCHSQPAEACRLRLLCDEHIFDEPGR